MIAYDFACIKPLLSIWKIAKVWGENLQFFPFCIMLLKGAKINQLWSCICDYKSNRIVNVLDFWKTFGSHILKTSWVSMVDYLLNERRFGEERLRGTIIRGRSQPAIANNRTLWCFQKRFGTLSVNGAKPCEIIVDCSFLSLLHCTVWC